MIHRFLRLLSWLQFYSPRSSSPPCCTRRARTRGGWGGPSPQKRLVAGFEAGCSSALLPVCDPGAPGEECKQWCLTWWVLRWGRPEDHRVVFRIIKTGEKFFYWEQDSLQYNQILKFIAKIAIVPTLITLQFLFFIYLFIFLQLVFKTLNTVSLSTLFEEERCVPRCRIF